MPMVIEGTWEDVLKQATDFAGRQVRVEVFTHASNGDTDHPRSFRGRSTLAALDELDRNPLSESEIQQLDDLQSFIQGQRFQLRSPEDLD